VTHRADRSDPSLRKIGLFRMTILLAIIIVGYLLGSIPFGYLLVRIFRGEDVRQSGSGNIGATNVARKSPMLGAITLLLDAAKGAGAVVAAFVITYKIADRMSAPPPEYSQLTWAALSAIIGHMFPVWLKFRGGKGVATALGSFALIAPKTVLVAAAIFILVVLIFRYISLGSIIAALSFPVLAWAFDENGTTGALALMSLSSLLIIFKHRGNIRRLLAGTENRFGEKSKNSPELTRSEKLTRFEKK
jgi:acyl phosphate:glycerol-3-phosphate acyltransferase